MSDHGERVLKYVWHTACDFEAVPLTDESVATTMLERARELDLTQEEVDLALEYWREATAKQSK